MTRSIAIHWFRQDLRLADNPALVAGAKHQALMPIFIFDPSEGMAMGGASRWWLHSSLQALRDSLSGRLSLYKGKALDVFLDLLKRYPITHIYWNRCYEPWVIRRDMQIKKILREKKIEVKSFNASLLWDPVRIRKKDGTIYKIFTPYYRQGCLRHHTIPRAPCSKPADITSFYDTEKSLSLASLELLDKNPWHKKLSKYWQVGEYAAAQRLRKFIGEKLPQYKKGRDFLGESFFSKLSAALHFGEISPNQLWYAVRAVSDDQNTEHFCMELVWREFSYYVLYHNPDLPSANLQKKFDQFPWQNDKKLLKSWQEGNTGIPIVDAGMRELWQSGYMHNRVRMIVGSFLVKNLLVDWRQGARWFLETLVDADLASNSANWQWVAGCGTDAAPFFRVFNPVLQGQKFDPAGIYVRRFVPELSTLPDRYLFNPWRAPNEILKKAKVILGDTYPEPIVDLSASRKRALALFSALKKHKKTPE